MLALPVAAQPPLLFTPTTKVITQFDSGFSITLDNGRSLSVDRFRLDYRVTDDDREVATHKQSTDGWIETPGGGNWLFGKGGKWRTGTGGLFTAFLL